MTKQKSSSKTASQESAVKDGTDVQAGGGVTPSAGDVPSGEPPTGPPPVDSNNPTAPAAAASLAPSPFDPEPAKPAKGAPVADLDADEVARDATDKPDQKQKRRNTENPLDDAVGSGIVCFDWGRSTWKLKNGYEFSVTRFYPTKRVAIDFPADDQEAATCEEKRAKLHEFDITYVAIMPGKNMTAGQIIEAIAKEQAAMIRKGE